MIVHLRVCVHSCVLNPHARAHIHQPSTTLSRTFFLFYYYFNHSFYFSIKYYFDALHPRVDVSMHLLYNSTPHLSSWLHTVSTFHFDCTQVTLAPSPQLLFISLSLSSSLSLHTYPCKFFFHFLLLVLLHHSYVFG